MLFIELPEKTYGHIIGLLRALDVQNLDHSCFFFHMLCKDDSIWQQLGHPSLSAFKEPTESGKSFLIDAHQQIKKVHQNTVGVSIQDNWKFLYSPAKIVGAWIRHSTYMPLLETVESSFGVCIQVHVSWLDIELPITPLPPPGTYNIYWKMFVQGDGLAVLRRIPYFVIRDGNIILQRLQVVQEDSESSIPRLHLFHLGQVEIKSDTRSLKVSLVKHDNGWKGDFQLMEIIFVKCG